MKGNVGKRFCSKRTSSPYFDSLSSCRHSAATPTYAYREHVRIPSALTSPDVFSPLRRTVSAPPVLLETPPVQLGVVRRTSIGNNTAPALSLEIVKPTARPSTSNPASSRSSSASQLSSPSDHASSSLTAAHGAAQGAGVHFSNLFSSTSCS